MAKRNIPEVNAGSMADIAFLLLIFFLVTTTMDIDTGLMRVLPPIPEDNIDLPEMRMRNVFVVLANANDNLLVEGEWMADVTDLKAAAKEFIIGKPGDPGDERFPEFKKVTDPLLIKYFGANQMISKQVVSLQNDRGTSYKLYIAIQDQLASAYTEVRNEVAMSKFGKSYDELKDSKNESDVEKAKAIRLLIPQRISEAEPKEIGAGG